MRTLCETISGDSGQPIGLCFQSVESSDTAADYGD